MVSLASPLMTLEAFEQLPDTGQRWELIDGELVEMSAASPRHSACAMRIGIYIGAFVLANKLGQMYGADASFLVSSDPPTVRLPDVAFLRKGRLAELGDTRRTGRIVPDFVVEVVSPSDVWKDVWQKAKMWLAAGAYLVWIVDPDDEVVISLTPGAAPTWSVPGDVLDAGTLIPGLQLPVEDIFSD